MTVLSFTDSGNTYGYKKSCGGKNSINLTEYLLMNNFPTLLISYMTEKHMNDINLARKCNISPMNIVSIKNDSHTYSTQLVEKLDVYWN